MKWSVALSNGGGTISEYVIELSLDSGATWTEVKRTSALTPTGDPKYDFAESLVLDIRKPYIFRVAAVNEAGRGPYSNIAGPVVLCPCDGNIDGGANGAQPQPLDDCGVCTTDGGDASAGFTGAPGECGETGVDPNPPAPVIFKTCTDLGDCVTYTGIGTPLADCTTCRTACPDIVLNSGNCSYAIPRLNVKDGNGGIVSTYTGPTTTTGYTGSITVTCNNGARTVTDVTCTENNCAAQTYTPDGSFCSYDIPAMTAGQTLTLNTTSTGYTGQIRVTCRAGELSIATQAACAEAPCAYTTYTSPAGCLFAAGPLPSSNQSVYASLINAAAPAGFIGFMYSGSALATCVRGVMSFTNITCGANCLGTTTTYGQCTFTTGANNTYVMPNGSVLNTTYTKPGGMQIAGYAKAVCTNGVTTWQNQSCADAPAAPSLTGNAGDKQITLNWTQGADGGSAISQFEILYTTPDATANPNTSNAAGTARSAVLSGLVNNQNYYVRIRATNLAGFTSAWSNVVVVTPRVSSSSSSSSSARAKTSSSSSSSSLCCAPDAPIITDLNAQPASCSEFDNPTAILIGWFVNSAQTTALYFVIERSTNNINWTARGQRGVTTLSNFYYHTDSDGSTAPNTRYYYRIRAVNNAGSSVSSVLNILTSAQRPNAPSSLTLTGVSSTSVQLTWQTPTIVGGGVLTNYRIRWRLTTDTTWNPAQSATVSSAILTYTIAGLTAGAAYTVEVAATNSVCPEFGQAAASTYTSTTPGQNCPAVSNYYYAGGMCAFSFAEQNSGAAPQTVLTDTSGYTGSLTRTCTNGVPSYSGYSCNICSGFCYYTVVGGSWQLTTSTCSCQCSLPESLPVTEGASTNGLCS